MFKAQQFGIVQGGQITFQLSQGVDKDTGGLGLGDISDALMQGDSEWQRQLCEGCRHLMPGHCWLGRGVVVGIGQWRSHSFKSVSSEWPPCVTPKGREVGTPVYGVVVSSATKTSPLP
ncbi:hypothetical protein D3C84_1062220 [compost metagenome]